MKSNFIFKFFIFCFFIGHFVYGDEEVFLKTPNLSDECIMGYTYGVRPYRKSGIRLEADSLGSKILIHNYGYGGSGMTLCWGGAQETLDLIKHETAKRQTFAPLRSVAVLGAGVVGLVTAYELLCQGYDVTIYADAFSPHLTSNVAAAIWSPPQIEGDERQQELLIRLTENSEKRALQILNSSEPEINGFKVVSGYHLISNESAAPVKAKFKSSFSESKKPVVIHFDNGVTKTGISYQGFGMDGKILMDDLNKKVVLKGVKIVKKHFNTTKELESLPQEIVVNCLSLGSRELFQDHDFTPVRGHMVYIKPQEGINYTFYKPLPEEKDYWMFMYPWSDCLVIGGVYEADQPEPVFDQTVVDKIIKHAREAFH